MVSMLEGDIDLDGRNDGCNWPEAVIRILSMKMEEASVDVATSSAQRKERTALYPTAVPSVE